MKETSTGVRLTTAASFPEHGYNDLERIMAERIANAKGPFFTTDADPDKLWEAYITNIPQEFRQHYTCHCCRRFIQRYGGLVRIDEKGEQISLLWHDLDSKSVCDVIPFFEPLFVQMSFLVSKANVNGVFLWGKDETAWGTPKTGEWTHLHGKPNRVPYEDPLKTPFQAMAELKESHGILCRSLAEYPVAAVREAVRILKADGVTRAEKALGIGQWFLELQEKVTPKKGKGRSAGIQYQNVVWLATATAPPGFCHLKTTVISTLLDDIVAGLPVEVIQRKWAEKMHPLQYQRPTAEPTEGNIREAEKIVEKLGLVKSFERRYAKLEDVHGFVWYAEQAKEWKEKEEKQRGVFEHLRKSKKEVKQLILPPTKITREKFRRTVLSDALELEVYIPTGLAPFYGLLTATHEDAPPILQWDGLQECVDDFDGDSHMTLPRNPVSWYFYSVGSHALNWGLNAGIYTKVSAVFDAPHQWQKPELFGHQGKIMFFALEGCKDRNKRVSLGLFPEILKAELRPIRATIEAHSNSGRGKLTGVEEGNANGIAFQAGASGHTLTVRVTSRAGKADYILDRWD